MNKKEVGKRLKDARDNRKLNIEDVANRINVSKSTISMWENGHRTPDVFTLMQLADLYSVDLNFLAGREMKGEIDFNYINADMVKVPIIGEVKAGYDLLAEQNIIGYSYVSKGEIQGGEYFWLKVHGNSMEGAGINEGDLVLVRRQPAVDEGQIAVLLIDKTEATIKRIFYSKGDQVILQSENSTCPPRIYNFEEVKVLGLVKEVKKKVK